MELSAAECTRVIVTQLEPRRSTSAMLLSICTISSSVFCLTTFARSLVKRLEQSFKERCLRILKTKLNNDSLQIQSLINYLCHL